MAWHGRGEEGSADAEKICLSWRMRHKSQTFASLGRLRLRSLPLNFGIQATKGAIYEW